MNVIDLKKKISAETPQIHYISNQVTALDVANFILSINATPIMAHWEKETFEISSKSDALVINMGASEYFDSIKNAIDGSMSKNNVILLDPVGCGASKSRREKCIEFIDYINSFENKKFAIRGNLSEIIAIIDDINTSKGIDNETLLSIEKDAVLKDKLKNFARDNKVILVISGQVDYLTDGDFDFFVSGGSSLMKKITGMGCMLSALVATFLSVNFSLNSAYEACKLMKKIGKNAEEKMYITNSGIGTYKILFFDEMYFEFNVETLLV